MDIKAYIESKNKLNIYDLTNDRKFKMEFPLKNCQTHYSIDEITANPFSENELFIFALDSTNLNNSFFNKMSTLNNILLFVVHDEDFKVGSYEIIKSLISHGYKKVETSNYDEFVTFIYDITDYKDNPDWLNNENWANPDLWEK